MKINLVYEIARLVYKYNEAGFYCGSGLDALEGEISLRFWIYVDERVVFTRFGSCPEENKKKYQLLISKLEESYAIYKQG